MMKLLIADDEESIRTGLKLIVDWEELGVSVCAEASNGNEAVEKIKDYSPDIVLLDIKMPGLTGIEVMENINEYCKSQGKNPPAFLILSGFSQFEYAQNALNLGAKGYLLKPVDEDDLISKINTIKSEITSAIAVQEDSKTAKKYEIREFYRNLLLNGISNGIKTAGNSNGDVGLGQDNTDEYTVLICSNEYFPDEDKTLIEKCVGNYFSFFAMESVNVNGNVAVVLKNANEDAVSNCIERFVKHYPENVFICRGKKLKGLSGCQESYREASKYLNILFFVNNINCISEELIQKYDFERNFNYFDSKFNDFCNRAVFCIETYDKVGLVSLCSEMKDSVFVLNAKSSEVKQKIISLLMEIYNRVTTKYPERELEDLQNLDIVTKILGKRTFEETFLFFTQVLMNVIESFHTNTADSVIVKVIAYVKTNYASDLKLETLGELFNCNSAYLGKKFRKYTGVQFNTYLDNLRIEEAKNKLLNTDLKIYQISKLVGYANTDYFFMKFKKATGMTPKEFKENVE
ncbi:MAG: response regulator [Treponema sp.]|nr:response regulator [Treponema sp.]